MTAAPRYRIEPHYEPNGPGSGWEIAPGDHLATAFVVLRVVDPWTAGESIIAAGPTRRAAESIVARLTAARRLEDANPPPPPPVKRAPVWLRFVAGIPFVLAFWFVAGILRAWLNAPG